MKTGGEFQTFYRSTLVHTAEGLEAERKKVIQMVYRAALIGGLVLLMNLAFAIFSNSPKTYTARQDVIVTNGGENESAPATSNNAGSILSVVILLGVLGYFFWVIPKSKELKSRYKKEVLGGLIKFVDDRLLYDPERGLSQTDYDQSKIFVSNYDRYQSEDMMSATLGKTAMRFSTVHTQRQERGESDNDRGSGDGKYPFSKVGYCFSGNPVGCRF